MKIVIAGASGFLGRHLVLRLISLGHEVICITRSIKKSQLIFDWDYPVKWVALDVFLEKYPSILNEADIFLNLITCYQRNGEADSEVLSVNVDLQLEFVKFSIECGIKRFITAGTALPSNINTYALAKHISSLKMQEISRLGNISCIEVVSDQIYGPADHMQFINNFIQKCMDGNLKKIDLTLGDQLRDFIYVDDLVSAYCYLINNIDKFSLNYERIEVSSGSLSSIKNFAENVKRLTGSDAELNFGAIPYRPQEMMTVNLDSTRLNEVGWRAVVSLEEGILKTIKYSLKGWESDEPGNL